MTGTKTIKERETEKVRGKRRYIERLIEEKEAEKELKEYKQVPLDNPDNDKEPKID